jgi:hypothetical protein
MLPDEPECDRNVALTQTEVLRKGNRRLQPEFSFARRVVNMHVVLLPERRSRIGTLRA